MLKKRKRVVRMPDPEQLRLLQQDVEINTSTVCRVECCICGVTDEGEDVDPAAFARGLYADGWREARSRKYAVEGAMCRACHRTPDYKRGD